MHYKSFGEWNEKVESKKIEKNNMHYFLIINGWLIVIIISIYSVFTLINSIKLLNNNPKKNINSIEKYTEIPDKYFTLSDIYFLVNSNSNEYENLISAILIKLISERVINIENDCIKIIDFNPTNLNKDELIIYNFLKNLIGNFEYVPINKIFEISNENCSFGGKIKEKILEETKKDLNSKKCYSKKLDNLIKIYRLKSIFFIVICIILCMLVPIFPKVMIPLILLTGFSSIFSRKVGKNYSGFTQKGYEEREKWLAYKSFIENEDVCENSQLYGMNKNYNQLIILTLFGKLEDAFKRLKTIYSYQNNDININQEIIDNIEYLKMYNLGKILTQIIDVAKEKYDEFCKNNYLNDSNSSSKKTYTTNNFRSNNGNKYTGGGR